MKKIFKRALDVIGIPITLLTSLWNVILTRSNERSMPISYSILRYFGILPVRDHYYQPMINPQKHLRKPLNDDRFLPGLNLNIDGQLELLSKFTYAQELLKIPMNKNSELEYYYNNGRYESGDSEYLYNMVRYFKPKNIIEIGSGMSTLMIINAEFNLLIRAIIFMCNCKNTFFLKINVNYGLNPTRNI